MGQWIIISIFIFTIIAFGIATFVILNNQGITQGFTTLTIVSIIFGLIVGLLALMFAIFQWRYPVTSKASESPVIASPPPAIQQLDSRIDTSSRDSHQEPLFWNFPRRRNLYFTGREALLESLHDQFNQTKTLALTQTQAIHGLGGIGKTQTAMEYAYRYSHEYRHLLWMGAATRDTLINDFVTIADLLHLPGKDEQNQMLTVSAVKQWLTENQNWLLILDNADDFAVIGDFLPTGDNGHILITTRVQAVGSIAHGIAVGKMDEAEGTMFLLRRARVLAADAPLAQAAETDRSCAAAIVSVMDGLPLALDQAGAYIEDTGCGLSSYLDLYKTRQKDLLQRRGTILSDHPESVATTWSLSFQRIEQANHAAADLLRLCAFLDPDAIPEEIFIEGASDLGSTLMSVAADPLKLDKAIAEVLRYSLMRRNMKEKMLSIHRLVQVVVQAEMNQKMQRQWAERAMRAVNHTLPEIKRATLPRGQRLLPHTQVCATLNDQYGFVFPEAAHLLMWTGTYLVAHAEYQQEEFLTQRALAIQEQMPGPTRPTITTKVVSLGPSSLEQGRNKEAESLYQRALKIREQALGPEHLDTAETLSALADLYLYQNRDQYEQAERLYQRALKIYEQALGPEHRNTASILNDLGTLYWWQDRYQEAESRYKQALAIREQVFGPEHPVTAISLRGLGLLYSEQGKYKEAEAHYQQALNIRKQVFGPEHLATATILDDLGRLYSVQGRYKEAESQFDQALAIRKQVSGPKHPDTVISLRNLGLLYYQQDKCQKAEPLFQQALEIYEKVWGPKHLSTVSSLDNLGTLYTELGRYKESEPLLQRALAICEQAPEQDHLLRAHSLTSLGMLYQSLHRYTGAESLLQRALEISEREQGSNHLGTAHSLSNLGMSYWWRGRYKEAEPLHQRALAIYQQVLGLHHPDTAYIRIKLGTAYRKLGRRKEAEEYYLQGVADYKEVLGLTSHRTGRVLGEVCWQLLKMGRIRQAAPMGVQALKSLGLKESIRVFALRRVILPAKWFMGRILWKS